MFRASKVDPGLVSLDRPGKQLCSIEPLTMLAAGGAVANLFGGLFGKKGGGAPVIQNVKQDNTQVTNLAVNTNVGALPDLSYTLGSYEATANRYWTGADAALSGVSSGVDAVEGLYNRTTARGQQVADAWGDYVGRISAPALSQPGNQSPIGTLVGFRPPSPGAPAPLSTLRALDLRYPWAKYAAAVGVGLLVLRKVSA